MADMASCPTYFTKLLYSMAEQNSVSQKILGNVQRIFSFFSSTYNNERGKTTYIYCNSKADEKGCFPVVKICPLSTIN